MSSHNDPSIPYTSRKKSSSIPQQIALPSIYPTEYTESTQRMPIPFSPASSNDVQIISPETDGKITVPTGAFRRQRQRPIGRTVLWQIMLLGVILGTLVTSLRMIAPFASASASVFQAKAHVNQNLKVVDRVPTFIQIDPTIGYLSQQQYETYSSADCSAAATSEVMTAWNDPTGDIGHIIVDMGNALSPTGGLVSTKAFTQVAQQEHFQILMTNAITTSQLAAIVRDTGIPVIIGVRDSYGGYYRYFAPGHFLVVTGADANGFFIVDSSTYFVHYLPTATFVSLWDYPKAVIYYPQGYTLQMPASSN